MSDNRGDGAQTDAVPLARARAAMKKLTLRRIEILVTVARLGSVKSAAEVVGVSKPYVSLTVSRSEEAFGISLFNRSSGVFSVSEEARPIILQFERALSEIDKIWQDWPAANAQGQAS